MCDRLTTDKTKIFARENPALMSITKDELRKLYNEIFDRLQEYEVAEETGQIIIPPFILGQKVWYISIPRRKENIFSVKVIYITHTDVGFIISVENENGHRFEMDAEDLYSSREEAEQALKGGVE